MTVKVFVSSTFKDLLSFREAVQRVIRQLGALDISMENFGARDERPKEECLRLIREESDIFVGIYAYRYGFIPAGSEMSIIEAEYQAAVSSGVPALIYLVDESTPWVPAHIDKGSSAECLNRLKNKLTSNHICEFFSSEDDLAAKVAADLGRHLSRMEERDELSKSFRHIDSEREYRLIQDLTSSDKYKVKRSIAALTHSRSPWLVQYLADLVMGLDKELADIAISALKEIPGRDSAEAIANGLSSSFTNIRSMAAFTLGEIALSGRREDAQATLDRLATALRNPGEGLRVLDEIVHSLGKIGGDQAFDSLVEILKTSGTPAELKAKALHGPGRFWGAADYSRFVSLATDIIKGWPIETCEGIRHSNIINHITNPLRVLILARLKIT